LKPISNKFPAFFRAVTGLVLLALPGLAAPITIVNPSFEAPAVAPGGFTSVATGWMNTLGSPVTDFPLSNQFASIPDGNQVEILDDFNGPGTLSQVLSTSLAANTTYTLTFFVGNDLLLPYTGYSAQFLANGVTLASDTSAVSPTAGHFLQDTITFNSGASPAQLGQPLEITFSDIGFNGVAFDLVQLDGSTTVGSSTPEPGTWMSMAGGIAMMLAAKYRRA
jgi:hypothetical protein